MVRTSPACAFAPFTLPCLALIALIGGIGGIGCTEPSGTGGTVDAPSPAAAVEPAPAPAPEEAGSVEAPRDEEAVLAAGDPAASDTEGSDPAVAEGEEAGETEGPPDEEAVLEPRRVLIVGSSLAATGFGAVLEDLLDANPDVVCYRKAKSASGLARPDFYDWTDQGKRQVEFRKPDLVIVIMGANDGQDIHPWKGSSRVRWGDESWPEAYRDRVDDFLASLATPVEGEDGARVMWLGLPKMPSPSLERKLTLIRGIHEEAIGALGDGGLYLDTTPYLVDDQGELLRTADVKGKERELRSEDGVHFTMSGCEYLAAKVYPEVLAALGLPAEPSE